LNVAEDRAEQPSPISDDAIRDRAHEIYEARTGEPGSAVEDWLKTEREPRGERNGE
jgi:hypothetical protein